MFNKLTLMKNKEMVIGKTTGIKTGIATKIVANNRTTSAKTIPKNP
jgi:hypothetical protein